MKALERCTIDIISYETQRCKFLMKHVWETARTRLTAKAVRKNLEKPLLSHTHRESAMQPRRPQTENGLPRRSIKPQRRERDEFYLHQPTPPTTAYYSASHNKFKSTSPVFTQVTFLLLNTAKTPFANLRRCAHVGSFVEIIALHDCFSSQYLARLTIAAF